MNAPLCLASCFALLIPHIMRGAVQADAGAIQTHLRLAHTLLAERKPDAAIPEFRAVLAAAPDNADAVGNLGVLLYFSHDYHGAEPLLRRTVEAQPLPKLKALLGMCERHNGNTSAARNDLAAALPGLDEPAIRREAGLELVELASAAGDLPAAAATISELKQKSPEDPAILYAAYRIYTDLSGEALLGLSVAAPTSARMHQAMAHELLRQRDTKAAVANYRLALAADPDLPGIHYELAEVLRTSPEVAFKAEAEAQYQAAVRSNPADVRSLTRLGDAAADRADHVKAIDLYKQALAVEPNDVGAEVGLAHELAETGDLPGALALLEAAEKTDPTDMLLHFRLSALYRRMHRPDDAKREVAEYEKYKAVKEKMRAVYKELKMDAPGTDVPQQ